jgi:DNA-binding NarL/FixJ family response regulator
MTTKVALVDDNQTFVLSVRNHLASDPSVKVVGQAFGGQDALRMIKELKPDVVLLDIAMPHMNGLEVARCLQRMDRAPAVIFLTMHDNNSYRKAATGVGAAGFVCKSNVVAELLPLIAQVSAMRAGADVGQP